MKDQVELTKLPLLTGVQLPLELRPNVGYTKDAAQIGSSSLLPQRE